MSGVPCPRLFCRECSDSSPLLRVLSLQASRACCPTRTRRKQLDKNSKADQSVCMLCETLCSCVCWWLTTMFSFCRPVCTAHTGFTPDSAPCCVFLPRLLSACDSAQPVTFDHVTLLATLVLSSSHHHYKTLAWNKATITQVATKHDDRLQQGEDL